VTKIIERKDGILMIKTCIYKEEEYTLLDVNKELTESKLFSDAVYNGVLNINALYKHFIDDNFQYNPKVQDHYIQESTGEGDCLHLSIGSLDDEGNVLRSHYVKIQLKF
jgi:hypothetical protein